MVSAEAQALREQFPDLKLTATDFKPAFVKPFTQMEGPTVWYGKDVDPEDLLVKFTPEDLEEIEDAVKYVQRQGIKIKDITKADFPLPTLGPKLEALHKDVIFGRGIRVLRNVPIALDKPIEYAVTVLWGMSSYFGKHQVLEKSGNLVGHVRHDGARMQTLSNCTPFPLGFHADNSDVVFLACRNQAKIGGNSACASSHALHNEILKKRPDLHKVLTEPFYSDRGQWWPTGAKPYYISPLFHYHENTLGVQEVNGIEDSAKYFGAPKPTALQIEAVKYVQEVAGSPDLRLDFTLRPGDILINHNLSTFHSRTAWVDGETEAEKRHCLRVWLASPHGWPLDPLYAERWVTTEVGKRGGLNCPGTENPHVTADFDEYVKEQAAWWDKYAATAHTSALKGGTTPQLEALLKKHYTEEEFQRVYNAAPKNAVSQLVSAQ